MARLDAVAGALRRGVYLLAQLSIHTLMVCSTARMVWRVSIHFTECNSPCEDITLPEIIDLPSDEALGSSLPSLHPLRIDDSTRAQG